MRFLFLVFLSFCGFADDWDDFLERQKKYNNGLIEYYDKCGRILINADYDSECEENYNGGYESPEIIKKLTIQAEKCSATPEYYDSKQSEVVICNPTRLIDKNNINPNLPPLTGSATSKLEKIVNKKGTACIQHIKPDDEIIMKVYEAITELEDNTLLKPIYEYLNESVSYDDIKISLLFLE